ncbi:hypothetical protein CEXT_259801 [Caerostris extrusa]|uniref:Uncharacterized protein n=1 Tax=Caerostris extrusa TaxID=172846 RepID=A0AAV4P1Y5_CAEEX|nr:hypothetical protein CEXT_259801 [Caerostris extrusa]
MGLDTSKDINPNAARGYILEKFTKHKGGVNCMIMEPEKYLMATGGEDKSIVLWRINTTPTQSKAILKGHTDYVSCLAFHEKYVISGSADCTIRKWDIATHECLYVFEGHTNRINKVLCAGDFVFSSSVDHTAKAWTLVTQKYEAVADVCLQTFEGHGKAVYPLVFIPDDDSPLDGKTITEKDTLITGSSDKTARIWSFKSGKPLHEKFWGFICITLAEEASIVFPLPVAYSEATPLFCLTVNKPRFEVNSFFNLSDISISSLYERGTKRHCKCLGCRPGRQNVVQWGGDGVIICWNITTGEIFTGCADTYSRMFKAKTGELKRVFKGHSKAVVHIEPVYDKVYTVSVDGTLRVWDTTGVSRGVSSDFQPVRIGDA